MKFFKIFLLVTTFLYSTGFPNPTNNGKFLSPSEAFKVTAVQNGDTIETKIILGDKIHVTAETLKYSIIKPKNIVLTVDKPEAHELDGDMVYEEGLNINIPVSEIAKNITGDYTLAIEFSGCSDQGICYNPIKKTYDFKGSDLIQLSLFDKIKSLTDESNPMGIVDVLVGESSLFIIVLFLVLGLLLALTPCIFPMIPILSTIIVSQSGAGKPSASKGFFISLIYVLSMAITYTIVGVISGLLGADIQSAMQNPWVLSTFAVMFFALAVSLFGYYEIQLPSKWQSKINSASDSAQGKGILGTAIMGFLSAFIIGPCVAPPLAGAVIFISQTGDALLGGVALFAMSIGMGLPLLLVGIGAGKFMPRPGGWMTVVSKTFAIVMLGLAIFMLGKVVSSSISLVLWSLLFMGTALYMGVFDGSHTRSGFKKLAQLLAFVFLIYGASLFIGFLSGSTSMLSPFEKFTTPASLQMTPTGVVAANSVVQPSAHLGYSIAKLEEEVANSKKPVMVDFRKKSCKSCDELEEFTFSALAVKEELKRFTFITIDVTENTEDDQALQKKYNAFGTPNIIFFDANNTYLPKENISGFVDAEKLINHLKNIN